MSATFQGLDLDLDSVLDNVELKPSSSIPKTKAELLMNKNHQDKDEQIDTKNIIKRADFYSYIPKDKRILGLDVSKKSTGWCEIVNGVRNVGNICLTGAMAKKYPEHRGYFLRHELMDELEKLFGGNAYDYIFIEDTFQGENAVTVRTLQEINTAIDELIFADKLTCKVFHRISNMKWKTWLYKIDIYEDTKAMKDKQRIQACLAMLGIRETGEGFQDRLDATGLCVGYFMNEVSLHKTKDRKFSLADLSLRYRATKEEALALKKSVLEQSDGPIEVDMSSLNKASIEKYLLHNPNAVYITRGKVSLGFLAESKKVKPLEGGGYVAFWITPSKREKYFL